MKSDLTEKFLDYLEGRLPAEERSRFERALTTDPTMQEALREYENVIARERRLAAETSVLARSFTTAVMERLDPQDLPSQESLFVGWYRVFLGTSLSFAMIGLIAIGLTLRGYRLPSLMTASPSLQLRPGEVAILVAAKPLRRGDMVQREDFAPLAWDEKRLPAGALLARELESLSGAVVRANVPANMPVIRGQLVSTGGRPVTVSLPREEILLLGLRGGENVRVVAEVTSGPQKGSRVTLVDQARLAPVNVSGAAPGRPVNLTLFMSERDQGSLELAQRATAFSRITLERAPSNSGWPADAARIFQVANVAEAVPAAKGRMLLTDPATGRVRFYVLHNAKWVPEGEEAKEDAALEICLPGGHCVTIDRDSAAKSSILDDYLEFGVSATVLEPVIAQAYDRIPHRRTPYRGSFSPLSSDLRIQLAYLFALVDEGVALRVMTLDRLRLAAPDLVGLDEAMKRYREGSDELMRRIERLLLIDELLPTRKLLLDAVKLQRQYFEKWELALREGKLFNHPRGQGKKIHPDLLRSSAHLHEAYDRLMKLYPNESAQNRQAFFDHLGALDFL